MLAQSLYAEAPREHQRAFWRACFLLWVLGLYRWWRRYDEEKYQRWLKEPLERQQSESESRSQDESVARAQPKKREEAGPKPPRSAWTGPLKLKPRLSFPTRKASLGKHGCPKPKGSKVRGKPGAGRLPRQKRLSAPTLNKKPRRLHAEKKGGG